MHRLAWQFGIRRERARWSAVTRETQILSEAQDLLGRLSWPAVDGVDDLTGEYWQIKGKDDEQAKLRVRSEELLDKVDALKEKLDGIEQRNEEQVGGLRTKKDRIMEDAAVLHDDIEEIRGEDQATRQRFASLKGKLDVLKKQSDPSLEAEIQKTRTALQQLKESHEENKKKIEAKEADVQMVENAVQKVDAEIAEQREKMRAETAELVAEIGRLSKQVAEISATIGSLENEKAELSFRVGQYLSTHLDGGNRQIHDILRPYRPIVAQIKQLRKSIQYNQRLARRTRA
ncbi:MAG: hypothetical protein KA004_12310 [Verrucomicrobiales bacterium]|nr:hypothetical protein [Verrucomicrobiales bacterium]